MEEKKKILTYEGLKKYEDELHELKVVKRKEVAEKIKEAREQGDLSENAEYDAAKDEQRDIEARIETLEKILKNAEVVVEEDVDLNEFADEFDQWIIDAFKAIGCDTAKSVLALSAADIAKRADLEDETVEEVMQILRSEFEEE